MKIITTPNKTLRKISKEIKLPLDDKMKNLIEEMIKHIDDSQKPDSTLRSGVGISAVQFGVPVRAFYINLNVMELTPFRDAIINPKVIAIGAVDAALEGGEGCLSVEENSDKLEGLVHRKNKIVIRGWSYFQKKEIEIVKTGYAAIVLQHELDHLDGTLFFDRINQKNKWAPKHNEKLI